MSAAKKPSWVARRRGPIYCAPACGADCKWADYERCVADAGALAERLGPEWEPRVWENFGWHWEVRALRIEGAHHDAVMEVRPPTRHRNKWCAEVRAGGKQFMVDGALLPETAIRMAHRQFREWLASLVVLAAEIDGVAVLNVPPLELKPKRPRRG